MIWKLIIAIEDKIRDKKLQYDVNREAAKVSALSSGKIDKYEYYAGEEILPSNQKRVIEQAKVTYYPPVKHLKNKQKQLKLKEKNKKKALEKHGKQQFKSSSKKEPLIHVKQIEIFEEFFNKRINEIQNLSKHIDFNNLTYYFKGENGPKIL